MSMMAKMKNYCSRTEAKALNICCRTEDPVLQEVLKQVPGKTDDRGWKSIVFAEEYTPEQLAALRTLGVSEKELETEDAYGIFGEGSTITVCSANLRGRLYGAYSVLQQAQAGDGMACGGVLFNVPQCSFRGLKVYLPGPGETDEFYRIVDFLLYYRCNTIIVEVGGAMEYKKHPEINESWVEYCREMSRYPERADEVQNMFGWAKNSIHFENGGGSFLPQETVRELARYCRLRGMEVIPEVPSLSHADYLLNAHQELAERSCDPFPDVYCPSNPGSYRLLFDVLEEVIGVFEPETVHIGHDECYSLGLCERCRGKDPAELYAGDITKIHDYLAEHGIKTMFWSEKVLNAIDKSGRAWGGAEQTHACSRNTSCHIPATHRAIDLIPQDCRAHNWYWSVMESGDREFLQRRIPLTFGNWNPIGTMHWQQRVDAGVQGGAPSHWTTLSETTLQRNGVLRDIVFGAYLCWNRDYTESKYAELLERCAQELFLYKNRKTLDGPHFLITHRTTVFRPWVYLTSAPMQLSRDIIGKYTITYESGQVLEIPLIYGVNIMNPYRSWQLKDDPALDCHLADSSLSEVMYTCLPVRQKNGETFFQIAVGNPYPGDGVVSVCVEKTAVDDGEILPASFEQRDCPPCFDDSHVPLQRHY